jgi:hypothetical protein
MIKRFKIIYNNLGGSAEERYAVEGNIIEDTNEEANSNTNLIPTDSFVLTDDYTKYKYLEQNILNDRDKVLIDYKNFNKRFVVSYKFTNGILFSYKLTNGVLLYNNEFYIEDPAKPKGTNSEDKYEFNAKNFDSEFQLNFKNINIKDIDTMINAFLLLKEDGEILKLKYNGEIINFPDEVNNIKQILSNENFLFALKERSIIQITINEKEIEINNTINLNCDTINMSLNFNFLVILCKNNMIKYYDYKNKRFYHFPNIDVNANLVKIDTYPLYHGSTDLYYGLTDKGTIKYWTIKDRSDINDFFIHNLNDFFFDNKIDLSEIIIKDVNARYKYFITDKNELLLTKDFIYEMPNKFKENVINLVINTVYKKTRTIYIQKIDSFLKLNYIKIDDSLINPSDNIKYKLYSREEINKQDILF